VAGAAPPGVTLRDHLLTRIRTTGPLTIADWMADCLTHPVHGYYVTRDPLGTDFTTAPEISQIFGELLGLALAQAWLDQGAPSPVTLAELGPGRGTLMADALRAMAGVPGLHAALRVHLVEASPVLRAEQARRITTHAPHWHDGADTLPDGPVLLIANEFLDALPIRQWRREGTGWSEIMVTEAGGTLAFAAAPPAPVPELDHHDVPRGTIVERCPSLPATVAAIAGRVGAGGAAILVDYGHWRSRGDTLQAMRGGVPVDPLADPGLADLTAHVDFEAIARHAPPARVSAMVTQGALLERLGATARAQALARGRGAAEVTAIAAAHRRLLHPAEMGDLFKAIALVPPGAALPPGFEAA